MIKFALATAVALTAVTPAVAQDAFSVNKQAEVHLKAHLDNSNERAVFVGGSDNVRFSTSNHSARAQAIFDQLRAESLRDE